MTGRPQFTIFHGFAASLALHSAVSLLIFYGLSSRPKEPSTLVIELDGLIGDRQAEEEVKQETKGDDTPEAVELVKPVEAPVQEASTDRREDIAEGETGKPLTEPLQNVSAPTLAKIIETSPPAAESKSVAAGSQDVAGAEERQNAETLNNKRKAEINRLQKYVKTLSKKVQANLVYPSEGRHTGLQGIATVSFAILQTGQIRPDTLKIIASSGQPKLDESALKTIRLSAPFDPPPKEMSLAIAVAFGRKH